MAETSRSQVTITLGRSGQVIKRAAPGSDVGFSDSMPAVGTKRSVRDRLGSNVDNSLSHGGLNSKRQRGDSDLVSSLSSNGVDDFRIGKNDLRYKLLEKNVRRAQSDDERRVVDLREKLSRMARPQSSSLDTLQRMPQPKGTSILAQVPPTRHSDNLPQMSYMRTPFTTWTLDHLRLKSPASIQSTSRGLSPPRIAGDPSRRALVRTYDDVRSVSYMNKDYFHSPRPVGAGPLLTNSNLPSGPAKPSAPLLTQPLPSGGSQKSSYAGDEQLSVDGLLHSLGLGKYSILFKAEEVDMAALKQMGENDLKELGIPMGPRKKILLAVLPRSKRQPL